MGGAKTTGIRRLVNAAKYSWHGLRAAWQHEEAFKQEVFACVVLVPLGVWLGESGVERALLVSSILLVPVVELLNSAIESVVDRHGDEYHPLSGRAKDMGSAAVLLVLLIPASIWGCILLPWS